VVRSRQDGWKYRVHGYVGAPTIVQCTACIFIGFVVGGGPHPSPMCFRVGRGTFCTSLTSSGISKILFPPASKRFSLAHFPISSGSTRRSLLRTLRSSKFLHSPIWDHEQTRTRQIHASIGFSVPWTLGFVYVAAHYPSVRLSCALKNKSWYGFSFRSQPGVYQLQLENHGGCWTKRSAPFPFLGDAWVRRRKQYEHQTMQERARFRKWTCSGDVENLCW